VRPKFRAAPSWNGLGTFDVDHARLPLGGIEALSYRRVMPKENPRRRNVTQERYTYREKGTNKTVAVLQGVLIWCPSCAAYKPAIDVGLRRENNGVIYVQNLCKACRTD